MRAFPCFATEAPMSRSRPQRHALPLAFAVAGALLALATGARAQTGVWRQIPIPGAGTNAVAGGDSGSVLAVTTAGVFRYDGLRIRRLPIFSARADSLDGTAVLEARSGDVWFGTSDQGLFRLRADGTVDRHTAANGIGNSSNDEILALAETADGAIWAGTNLGGLSRFDGFSWTTLTVDQGMPSMQVKALAADPRDGSLWAATMATGTEGGLVHVVGGAVAAVYDDFTIAPLENVRSVAVTTRGEVWVGNDRAVARLVGGAFEEIDAGQPITALSEGMHGEIWFGSGSRGVGVADAGALAFLPGGPPSNTVLDTYLDPAGVLWVATTGGLSRFEGSAWRTYAGDEGLPPTASPLAAIRDLSAEARGDSLDARGIAWFGILGVDLSPTELGIKLCRLANGRFKRLGNADGLPFGSVASFARGDSASIWCGTVSSGDGGVARVRADGTVAYALRRSQGLPSSYVLGLAQAGPGQVWVATAGGAAFVEPPGFRLLRVGPGALPDAALVDVAVDAQGRAWFATGRNPFSTDLRTAAGAVRFDPADSTFLAVTTLQGLPTNELTGVAVAPNGDVWFSSAAGAIRWRDGVMRTFTVADGLNSNLVRKVTVAPDGSVWAATEVGIVRFDGAVWSNFNVADGLAGSVAHEIFADSLGVIASCRQDGVSLFHPDRTPPRVEITSGPPAATGASRVQFGVRGGDLDSDASRVRISSELVGRVATPFEEDVDAVTLDLPDGDYAFRVRAKDRALNESAEPFEVRFTVDATPPRPVVQQPAFNAVVRDTVHVLGRVDDPRFAHYVVELRAEGTVDWDTLFTGTAPPPAGVPLYDWLSRDVDDGAWELRVGVADSLGLIGYSQVSVIVDNFAPGASVTSPALVDHVTGGRVFTTDGEVELYVPPNAFAANQIVRIDPAPLGPLPRDFRPGVGILAAWMVRANDPVLAKPATLSILDPERVSPSTTGDNPPLSQPEPVIARLVVAAGDTTLVAVGGARSADGTRLTTSIPVLGTYVIARGAIAAGTGEGGVSALDCQPRVLSPRGGGFDTRTAISFQLGRSGAGAVKVYDRAGRLMKEIAEAQTFAPGANVVYWDGTDGDGQVVPSGLYTVAVRFDGETAVRTVAVANR